jgi:hypothetical protein
MVFILTSSNIIITSRRMRMAVYVAHTERRGLYSGFFWEN